MNIARNALRTERTSTQTCIDHRLPTPGHGGGAPGLSRPAVAALDLAAQSPPRAADRPASRGVNALVDLDMDRRLIDVERRHTVPTDPASGRILAHRLSALELPRLGAVFSVRHGRTHANRGLLAGRVDEPVNQLDLDGILQAYEAGSDLAKMLPRLGVSVDVIIASPLGRAKDTARAVAEVIGYTRPIVLAPILTEHDCGVVENKAVRDLSSEEERVLKAWLGCDAVPRLTDPAERDKLDRLWGGNIFVGQTQGESVDDVVRRARLCLQWVEDHYPGKNVLLVSHAVVGGALAMLLGAFDETAVKDGGTSFFKLVPRNGEARLLKAPRTSGDTIRGARLKRNERTDYLGPRHT